MRQDPLALAVFGAALALLAGLLAYVLLFKAPEPAPAASGAILERLRVRAAVLAERLGILTRERTAPGHPVVAPRAGGTWTYRVSVEPAAWQDVVLTYRTVAQAGTIVVHTDFTHAKGAMKFQLGTFQAGHPSHANTRFPGFFLYPAYFGKELRMGQALAWEWPWQLPGGGVKPGRVKRYEGRVAGSEQYQGPAFPMASMLRIEGTLSYVEDGRVQAVARETLWYAGKAMQLVRIEREGRAPDEGATRIVAELAELRL